MHEGKEALRAPRLSRWTVHCCALPCPWHLWEQVPPLTRITLGIEHMARNDPHKKTS